MRKNLFACLAIALALGCTACKDTKTLQENDQLKAQVAQLQKENGQLGNDVESITAARDALAKENETLKAQLDSRKSKRGPKRTTKRKRRAA